MQPGKFQWLKRLSALLAVERTEPLRQEQLILAIQRNIAVPIRLLVLALVFYYSFTSSWLADEVKDYELAFKIIFAIYAVIVVVFAALFYAARRFPIGKVRWCVFALGIGDAVLLGSLTIVTGGFESVLYWVYPGIIIINAFSIPTEAPQVILNLILSIIFLAAGLVETEFSKDMTASSVPLGTQRQPLLPVRPEELNDLPEFVARLTDTNDPMARATWARFNSSTRERILQFSTNRTDALQLAVVLADELNRISRPAQSVVVPLMNPDSPEITPGLQVLRVAVLTLLTFSIYGVQVLLVRQRKALAEQQEFAVLAERLHTAGRVAAEFAHQIKNPLAIINNVIFSLQKSAPAAEGPVAIIREEVSKCDRIITQIMGYGELNEGRIERLEVGNELEAAIRAVFPPGLHPGVEVRRSFARHLPPLLMQRLHLADVLMNLIINAREAVGERGLVYVSARRLDQGGLEILVRDDGPGIPPEKLERIFEAYYTTKSKGTGLGLAIVKHNVELYSGTIRVQSELGKGAEFIITYPGKGPTT
jgi:signal transduction histidine kinase